MDNRRKISFEDTDRNLELDIYGKEFKINESKISNLKIDDLTKEEKDVDEIETLLDEILGKGAVNELNKIRKENGYDKMELSHELAILMAIIELYSDKVLQPINKMADNYQNMYNRVNNYNNRYNRRNNKYRRY